MKNVIIFAGDDIVACQFLSDFIPAALGQGINPVIVKVENKHHQWDHPEMKRYAFYEDTLLNTHVFPYLQDNPSPVFKMFNIDQLQEQYGLSVLHAKNVNDAEFIEKIRSINFVGAISIRCFQIFKKPLIDTIKEKGFFANSHPGLLPNYRGVFCMLREIVESDSTVGWNLHIVEEGIDTGDIIKEITVPNTGEHNMIQLFTHTIPHLVKGWMEFTMEWCEGKTTDFKSQTSHGRYFTYPTDLETDQWLATGALKPLSAKTMVQHYCDIFYPEDQKFSKAAQDFKIFLINKVARFETMIELEKEIYTPAADQKKAA